MRLYAGTSIQFIEDTVQNQIAEKLKQAFFFYYRFNPSPGEVNSWRNSLRSISQVFEHAQLLDHGVILEYQLPMTSRRLDCMICGQDTERKDNAVIVELKQWEKCEGSDGDNEVTTWLNGRKRDVLHPSVQVGQYKLYLQDTHTAFYAGSNPVNLNACTYLHNYSHDAHDVIFDDKFTPSLERFPLFTADDVDRMIDYLRIRLRNGQGSDVLNRVEKSKYRPCKKLMDHVGNLIKNKKEYVLLDEQLIVYDTVLTFARKGFHDKKKAAIIIKGGPGTGKSVIAINLMAELLLKGYNAHYATGSKAFTETLRKIIGTRGAIQFKYFNSYMNADNNAVDVLIADEAHRIRTTSNSRFTKKENRSSLSQIEEIMNASKVSVFFIDDNQVVRPNEVGSTEYIKQYALEKKANVIEYELEAQFRCNGSEAFVNWINNTLGIKRTANVIWDRHEEFDFKIFSSPETLEAAIRNKVQEGHTGRVTAGFCWKWSNPRQEGTLLEDVVIGNYKRPWDAKPDARKLAPGIPKASLWAYDPAGIDQVGCVYTAQGFEFDYVGVIFGEDIIYDFDKQAWIGLKENSADEVVKRSKDQFVELVKNTYRVLLTRGMKGCYVYFMNKDTERFFKSRIEGMMSEDSLMFSEVAQQIEDNRVGGVVNQIEESLRFKEYLPVYSLAAACGRFGEGQEVSPLGWMRVDTGRRLNRNMFVIKTVGLSMEPRIKDGSYCVFQGNVVGSRNGKIVLVELRQDADPDTGRYTIKRYSSRKVFGDDGQWKHEEIILEPLNSAFDKIVLNGNQDGELKVVAEFWDIVG